MPTTQTKTTEAPPTLDLSSTDAVTERIRALNERVINSSKGVGLVALGAYEKALQSLLSFEDKAASATQLDWIEAVANTHATFIKDLSASYTKAARDVLK